MPDSFTCPECTDTYQAHWLEPDSSGLCRSCAASRDGRCYMAGHPDHASPCSGPAEDVLVTYDDHAAAIARLREIASKEKADA